MFYSKEVRLAQIDFRINLLRERGEEKNLHLINALLREKRLIELSA